MKKLKMITKKQTPRDFPPYFNAVVRRLNALAAILEKKSKR